MFNIKNHIMIYLYHHVQWWIYIVKFLDVCSFWENLAKLYVGPPGGLGPPPQGNPVSATDFVDIYTGISRNIT